MNRHRFRVLVLLSLVAGITFAVVIRDHFDATAIEIAYRNVGPAAPFLFITLYVVGTVLFLPGSVLTVAGGALFGPILGTLCNLVGATIGAALAFLMARYLAFDWVRVRLERSGRGKFARLLSGVESEGWRFVAFTRLVPLFPFNLLNYALGLTRISFLPYLVATVVFMLPGAVAYTYLGYAGRESVSGQEGLIRHGLTALALLAAAVFLSRMASRLRQPSMIAIEELKARVEAGCGLVLDVRTAAEFVGDQGHIVTAMNVPLEELDGRLTELGDDLARPIAIVCRTDRRSAQAATLLARHGFASVRVARGGMTAWRAHGWPVERAERNRQQGQGQSEARESQSPEII